VRLAGFSWTRADFCRGWLITGDTGSGKTRSGITPLLFQVFQNEPTWAACVSTTKVFIGKRCVKRRGTSDGKMTSSCCKFARKARPRMASAATPITSPQTALSLYTTFAKAVVDTASILRPIGRDKGFFRNQAQTHIAVALETLREIGADVNAPTMPTTSF